jgi:hypothetical protein
MLEEGAISLRQSGTGLGSSGVMTFLEIIIITYDIVCREQALHYRQ